MKKTILILIAVFSLFTFKMYSQVISDTLYVKDSVTNDTTTIIINNIYNVDNSYYNPYYVGGYYGYNNFMYQRYFLLNNRTYIILNHNRHNRNIHQRNVIPYRTDNINIRTEHRNQPPMERRQQTNGNQQQRNRR